MKGDELPPVSESAIERYNDDQGSAISVRSLDDIKRLSTIFIESGMFKGDKSLSTKQQLYQAGVKIIAGVEFGIQPFAAMRGINIINGNAEMSANLMAAKVKKHPKYDYRVNQWDNEGCVIEFFELTGITGLASAGNRESLGLSSFTRKDAEQAQLSGGQNWRKFPRNMYFARAMSNGVRLYTPDVFYGAPVYVEGEISGEFDGSQPEQPKALQAEEAEVVPQVGETELPVYRDIAAEEAELVERTNTDEPEVPAADDGYDDEDPELMETVASELLKLDLPTRSASRLIRETVKKMALKHCRHGDLVRLAEEIDRIKSGERVLSTDWYDSPVEEAA